MKQKESYQVRVDPNLREKLLGESTKKRSNQNSKLLDKKLRKAAKELRDNENIVIRRADKSAIFVILDKDDYTSKINSILSDTSKFEPVTRDNTNALKAKVNRIITAQ